MFFFVEACETTLKRKLAAPQSDARRALGVSYTGQAGAVPSARNESQPHLNLAVHTSGTAQTLWHEEPDLDSSFEQDDRDQPTLD
jgi:hypothetical protein